MAEKTGMVIVLSGFSGAGKGTIMKHLLSDYPGKYFLSVSATTRQKRQGEEEGERNIVGVKGHRILGGMRASCYNAVPAKAVDALLDYMEDFERAHAADCRTDAQ